MTLQFTPTTIFETPYGKDAIRRVIYRGQTYWMENVYKYYRRHTGKLGQSCRIEFNGNQFHVNMAPLLDLETGMDYGRSIRHGIQAGEGAYDPVKGVRKKTGFYPGVSIDKYWQPWMSDFQVAFDRIVHEEVEYAVNQYIRYLVRGKV